MEINEAKVGMYISKIGNPYIQRIDKVNLKSVSCGWSNIKEVELKNYIVIDEEVVKARTIKEIFTKECGKLSSLTTRLMELGQIIKRNNDCLIINSEKLNKMIEETLENVNNAIKEVLECQKN